MNSGNQKKTERLLITGSCILLVIIFLCAGFRMISFALSKAANDFFYPYLKIAKGTAGEIQDKSLLSLDRLALAHQVEKLSQRNRELAVRSTAAAGILDENRILRQKLKLSAPPEWSFHTAEIIMRSPLHFRAGFTIDKGSKDGIFPGDAVVDSTTDGRLFLIGVVRECSGRTARVSTVADPSLRISGRLPGGVVGFTNSGIGAPPAGLLRFGMLPGGINCTPGEAIVTTGYERGIPEGIKIGEVSDISDLQTGDDPDQTLFIVPAVKFENLRFVTVVSRSNGWRQ